MVFTQDFIDFVAILVRPYMYSKKLKIVPEGSKITTCNTNLFLYFLRNLRLFKVHPYLLLQRLAAIDVHLVSTAHAARVRHTAITQTIVQYRCI